MRTESTSRIGLSAPLSCRPLGCPPVELSGRLIGISRQGSNKGVSWPVVAQFGRSGGRARQAIGRPAAGQLGAQLAGDTDQTVRREQDDGDQDSAYDQLGHAHI